MNCSISRDNNSPASLRPLVSTAISARQSRIQQLFAGKKDAVLQGEELPQVQLFEEKKITANIQDHQRSSSKTMVYPRKNNQKDIVLPGLGHVSSNHKKQHVVVPENPTNDDDGSEESSNFDASTISTSYGLFQAPSPVLSVAQRYSNEPNSKQPVAYDIQLEIIQEQSHASAEPVEPPHPKQPPQPVSLPCTTNDNTHHDDTNDSTKARRGRTNSLVHQISQMRSLTAHLEHKNRRKQMHQQVLDNARYCQELSQQMEQERKQQQQQELEDASHKSPIMDLPLHERQAKRQERLNKAKERIQRQQEAQQTVPDPLAESRQEAFEWYIRHGMPSKRKMKERLQQMRDDNQADTIPLDHVDLLDWMPGDFLVDLTAVAASR